MNKKRHEEESRKKTEKIPFFPRRRELAETGLPDEEFSSLKTALSIMLIVSAAVLISTLDGIKFFQLEFELAIVYSPTILLLIGWSVARRKRTTADNSTR